MYREEAQVVNLKGTWARCGYCDYKFLIKSEQQLLGKSLMYCCKECEKEAGRAWSVWRETQMTYQAMTCGS